MNLPSNDAMAYSRAIVAARAQAAAMTNRLAGCHSSEFRMVRVRNAFHLAAREAETALLLLAARIETDATLNPL